MVYGVYGHFQQYFSYIVASQFYWWRKPEKIESFLCIMVVRKTVINGSFKSDKCSIYSKYIKDEWQQDHTLSRRLSWSYGSWIYNCQSSWIFYCKIPNLCQSLVKICPNFAGHFLPRTDTSLVFCNRKFMRTDILFTRTTKPTCNFVKMW
jgi:hypothetical protein